MFSLALDKMRKYAHGGDWSKMGRSDKQFIIVLEQKRPLRSVCQRLAPLSEKESGDAYRAWG